MLINVLNVEIVGAEVKHIALVVRPHVIWVAERAQYRLSPTKQALEVGSLIFKLARHLRMIGQGIRVLSHYLLL